MKALSAALVASLLLTACATGPGPETRREFYERRVLRANPSKVIATELAFARTAQEKGQWTAFAEFATDDATMFVPEPVNAKDWLKRQVNPPRAVAWQPHQVWSSCDGTLTVTKGAWQRPDGSVGYFTTVWERQGRPGDDEEYRWVLDQGDTLAEPLPEPDFIGTQVADCGGGALDETLAAGPGGSGRSDDGTLAYSWTVAADLSRTIAVTMLVDGEAEEVLTVAVAAPSGG